MIICRNLSERLMVGDKALCIRLKLLNGTNLIFRQRCGQMR